MNEEETHAYRTTVDAYRLVIARFLGAWWPAADGLSWIRGMERTLMTRRERAAIEDARKPGCTCPLSPHPPVLEWDEGCPRHGRSTPWWVRRQERGRQLDEELEAERRAAAASPGRTAGRS